VGTPTFLMYREFIPARDLAKQWPPTSWMWKMEESGGPLYTLAVWSIDLLRWLTRSDIVQVTAATKYTVLPKFGGTFGYDASASVKFGNGMVGCLQYSATVGESSTVSALEIIGDANTFISAVGNDTCTLLADDPCKSEWKMKEPGPRMWGHAQMDEYYVRCVLEGRTPDITPADGRRAMEIAWQIAKAT
ncbi:MAG: Gfo/Idh/MocA family oxidoreductase, partial [Pirellulaceae bacterium]|nr:Gfo/Idh/MocA family oxidoreductase [Pirellulaceae bacterium]